MKTRLVKIGNSQGILISKSFLNHYHFENEVLIEPQEDGLLIKPLQKSVRQDWEHRFQQAIQKGDSPEGELLEGFSNAFETDEEWSW